MRAAGASWLAPSDILVPPRSLQDGSLSPPGARAAVPWAAGVTELLQSQEQAGAGGLEGRAALAARVQGPVQLLQSLVAETDAMAQALELAIQQQPALHPYETYAPTN